MSAVSIAQCATVSVARRDTRGVLRSRRINLQCRMSDLLRFYSREGKPHEEEPRTRRGTTDPAFAARGYIKEGSGEQMLEGIAQGCWWSRGKGQEAFRQLTTRGRAGEARDSHHVHHQCRDRSPSGLAVTLHPRHPFSFSGLSQSLTRLAITNLDVFISLLAMACGTRTLAFATHLLCSLPRPDG